MPLGLIRKTRPSDCSAPRMLEISLPVTRFSTARLANCWNLVSSLIPMEKPFQLMMALPPAWLVMVSALVPRPLKPTLPCATVGPLGFAPSGPALSAKHAATDTASSFGLRENSG